MVVEDLAISVDGSDVVATVAVEGIEVVVSVIIVCSGVVAEGSE